MATLEQLDAYGSLDGAILNAYTLEQLDALQPLLASGSASIYITESTTPTLRKWTATLEQLDAFGTLEQLDTYGTLEELNFLVVHEASASESVAINIASSAIRVPTVSASSDVSITTSATSNFLVNIDGSADISITDSAAIDRFRTVNGRGDTFINQTSVAVRIMTPTITDSDIAITNVANLYRIQPISSDVDILISVALLPEILGETWTDVSGRAVSWSIAS